jgi:D-mannonate dehydratase
LIENIELRSILLHPRLKDDSMRLEQFKISIEEYKQKIEKIDKVLEEKTNLPIDIIKYNIIKFI